MNKAQNAAGSGRKADSKDTRKYLKWLIVGGMPAIILWLNFYPWRQGNLLECPTGNRNEMVSVKEPKLGFPVVAVILQKSGTCSEQGYLKMLGAAKDQTLILLPNLLLNVLSFVGVFALSLYFSEKLTGKGKGRS